MRVITNEKLIQKNNRLANYLFFVSLFILILGFILINAPLFVQDIPESFIAYSTLIVPIVLLVSFITTIFSVRMTNLWKRVPRPEKEIPDNLKGMSKNTVLYNYYHFPARHVLISKEGVFAIVTRFQEGNYSVSGDKWKTHRSIISSFFSLFRMDGIRNPTADALIAADHVQKLVDPIAPDIKVQPVILFTDPRAKLTIEDPTVPVVNARTHIQPSFKDYLKKIPKEQWQTLTPEQIDAFEKKTVAE